MSTRARFASTALIALFSLGGLAACASNSSNASITDVSASGAAGVLAQSGVTVIDVRSADEFASGHLPDAVNIDIEGGSFDEQIADLPKDDPYFVYCQSGNRSGVATDQLAAAGFTKLYDLQGGITGWQAAGGAVVLR